MNIGKGGSDQLKNNAVERFVGDKIILVAGGAGFYRFSFMRQACRRRASQMGLYNT